MKRRRRSETGRANSSVVQLVVAQPRLLVNQNLLISARREASFPSPALIPNINLALGMIK
jgi:hypothetical protein